MKRFWILGFAALALALSGLAPVPAGEAPTETSPAVRPAQGLDLGEEPNMTPADAPEAPDLLGLEEAERLQRAPACQPNPCPSGCQCVAINNHVNCYCWPPPP